jgi:hypothetical protein
MISKLLRCLALVAMSLITGSIQAQHLPFAMDVQVPGVTRYNPDIPKPETVIGHVVGTRHTRSHLVEEYYRTVAAASNRVVVNQHGATYEGRRLVHAVVTSPGNHARLEEIRRDNYLLSDTPNEVTDEMIAEMPGIIHLGYGVHGNEASSSEAAMLVLYHLAAGEGPAVDDLLNRAVVILDPNYNPDGRDRFVNWANGNRGAVPTHDAQDREHIEPWPGGRTNHYWFDLNRDWMPVQHPESQGRIELFHHWRAQVLTDFHEMGSNATHFFMPGIPSRNNPNTPQGTFDLTAELATYHAKWHDRQGTLYYTKESFDDFYYGKGSTYPDVNGAIGILFEQASSRALERQTTDGVMTFAFTIRNQFTSSMSTLEGSLTIREKLLTHQRDFYASARQVAQRNPVKAHVLGYEGARTRAQAMAQMLLKHRIRVYHLARQVDADGRTFQPGEALIVPMDQPQARLIHAMMERMTTFQDSLFYDISTWTMPLAFRVPHGEVRQSPTALLGDEITEISFDGGQRVGGRSNYIYLMEWGRYFAPRALYKILKAGIKPRVTKYPFSVEINGAMRQFDRGTIVIPVSQRDARTSVTADQVHALMDQIVREDQVVVHAAQTGLTLSGNDLGSRSSPVLALPEIAMLSGAGSSAYEVGETWHLLNERFGIPVSLLDISQLGSVDLDRYTTIVMVSGSYNMNTETTDKLKLWISSGGVLITWRTGARWAINNELVTEEIETGQPDTTQVAYERVGPNRDAHRIGGSIFEVALDTTHPLAFGYGDMAPVFRNHELFFQPSKTPGATVARYTSSPLLSGYISSRRLAELKGTSALIARRSGNGSVVLFADNPNFRAFWYGSNGLFLNAIFFGKAF